MKGHKIKVTCHSSICHIVCHTIADIILACNSAWTPDFIARSGLGSVSCAVIVSGSVCHMTVASGPAGPVLAGPVFTVIFGTAHAQIMNTK